MSRIVKPTETENRQNPEQRVGERGATTGYGVLRGVVKHSKIDGGCVAQLCKCTKLNCK